MLALTYSAIQDAWDGNTVRVEAATQNSLPQIQITGLPGDVVRESRERIRACLGHLGLDVPTCRVIVHLSPAYEKKQGSQLDLAIALAVLGAEGRLGDDPRLSRVGFLGELALDGRLQPIRHLLPLLHALEIEPSVDWILIPKGNAIEASLLSPKKVLTASNIAEVIDWARGIQQLESVSPRETACPKGLPASGFYSKSLKDIQGNSMAKRALSLAITGRHHLLFMGAPGVGKSLLALTTPELLPPLSDQEFLEVAKIRSQAGENLSTISHVRPFRSPHHTASAQAVLGGGSSKIFPGEVTLAHAGALFLDELPEFRRDVLEGLREPLQNGTITISRSGKSISLPAHFTFLGAMNPCPCGYSLERKERCRCSQPQIMNYRRKISGPMLDRISLFSVLALPGKDKETIKEREFEPPRILEAIKKQNERFQNAETRNGDVSDLEKYSGGKLQKAEEAWVRDLMDTWQLSYRKINQLVRVARTIADIEEAQSIEKEHLLEAWGYKCPDSFHQSWASLS
jgi:magnesium chelatase family protein